MGKKLNSDPRLPLGWTVNWSVPHIRLGTGNPSHVEKFQFLDKNLLPFGLQYWFRPRIRNFKIGLKWIRKWRHKYHKIKPVLLAAKCSTKNRSVRCRYVFISFFRGGGVRLSPRHYSIKYIMYRIWHNKSWLHSGVLRRVGRLIKGWAGILEMCVEAGLDPKLIQFIR